MSGPSPGSASDAWPEAWRDPARHSGPDAATGTVADNGPAPVPGAGPDSPADPLPVLDRLLERHDAAPAGEDAELLAALAAAGFSGEAGSPLRALADAVGSGRVSWARVWADPSAHGQGGLDLVTAVMAQTARLP